TPSKPSAMSNSQDLRLGDLIEAASEENLARADVIFFGVPTDEGIIRNGGRPGAAQAPDEIRKYLAKLTPFNGAFSAGALTIVDAGNVQGRTLEEIHQHAREFTTTLAAAGKTIVVFGGGHDVTYPLASGFRDGTTEELNLINVDAHLDVRPK